MFKIITTTLLLCSFAIANNVNEIIKKVETNLNGKTAQMNMSMEVYTKKNKRTIKMHSLSVGKEKSFIKVLYPKKDKGITFLKLDNQMWQYVPRIERTIKIPASMMLQSWMGSDFSNDDLVKESSILDDYDQKLLSKKDEIITIELIPKEDAAVVWGKIIMQISLKYHLPLQADYYDEDDVKIRTLFYKKIQKFKDRFYPTYWEVLPLTQEKKGHKTIMSVQNVIFDEEIKKSYFTKRALKRYSK